MLKAVVIDLFLFCLTPEFIVVLIKINSSGQLRALWKLLKNQLYPLQLFNKIFLGIKSLWISIYVILTLACPFQKF